jgi:MFS family permease
MRLLTDITPLRTSPAFRRLWLGTMLSATGSAMTSFAVGLQVYDLTKSTAAVGGIGLAALIPMLVITVPGGTLADRVDRRRLVIVMSIAQAVVPAALFAVAAFGGAGLRGAGFSGTVLWSLYALVAAGSALGAISAPARQTFIRQLVPAEQLPAAMALNRIVFQVMMIAGPGLAGVVTAWSGVRGCYLADVVSFAGAMWGVSGLPAAAPQAPETGQDGERRRTSGMAQTLAGLAFIRRSPVLCGAFLADVNATFFALPISLFPAINAERFHADPRTLGLFTIAIGVGGLVSSVLAGPLKHARRHGVVMLACVAVWGGGFATFAVARSLWLTLLSLAVAGFADTFTVVVRGIIVQEVTPKEFRGRVNAADFLVGAGGGQLGSLEAGLVGSWMTPEISALSGGLLTIAGVVAIAAALPGFRRYRSPTRAAEPEMTATAAGQSAPALADEALEDERDQHLAAGPVGRVVGGKLLGHVALLVNRAVDEVDRQDGDRYEPDERGGEGRADHAADDAGVDGVPDQPVGAAGDQVRVLFPGHRHAPVPADVDPGPYREAQAGDP